MRVIALSALFLSACSASQLETSASDVSCATELIVLGIGQDAGAPQIGNRDDPAWADRSLKLTATSIALVDHRDQKRYLFEATPHITEQLQLLDDLAPMEAGSLGVDGVFLTHAHIGHYAGLMFFGREAAGAKNIPVHVMPRFADYLESNGPWSQLVSLGNIDLQLLAERTPAPLGGGISVTPYRVPHRDEYSETVAYIIEAGDASALFVPDIDSWEEWETEFGVKLTEIVETVDYAFLDATFFDDNELPGRDMSLIPHPRVTETMYFLQDYPDDVRARVHFIHINHTNKIRFEDSEETQSVLRRGFRVAREGQKVCLKK